MLGKRVKWENSIRIVRHGFLLMLLLWGTVQVGYGQDKKRTYANFQGTYEAGINLLGLLTGNVSNPGNAINGNVKSYSTLSVPLGVLGLLSATQYLEFTTDGNHSNVRTIMGGTPVTVKSSFPREVLGLLSNVEIGYFNYLEPVNTGLFNRSGYKSDNQIVVYSGSSLLNLINGTGQFEITLTPPVNYHGIFVKISGNGLNVLLSNQLFHAYIYEDYVYSSCEEKNEPLDVLYGTRSEAIGALTSLGGVTNPYNAINGNVNDYATMAVGVGALNTVYLNTIFQTPSQSGQKLRIILERPGSILDLGLLSQFSIQPYLRDQPAGPPLAASSPLLNLRLLPGTNKYELAYDIDEVFDRVELRFDNIVTALASLRVYEVSRLPRIMLIEDPNMLSDSLTNCGQVDLSAAIANYQPDHYDYRYYTVANGGTALDSSVVTSSGTYYIEAIDPVTGCASERVPVTATVIALPEITLSAIPAICEGEITAVIEYSSIQNGANEYSIEWDDNASGFPDVPYTVLPEEGVISISIPPSATTVSYNGILKVRNTETGCESGEYPLAITILPLPGNPNLTISEIIN